MTQSIGAQNTGIYRFQTKTQYDNGFNKLFSDYPKAKKGFSCSYFAIISLNEYFKDHDIGVKKHGENIERAVNISAMMDIDRPMSFHNLLQVTSLKESDVGCTSADLLKTGEMSLQNIIPDLSTDFGIIFLKNAKFFVVIGNSATKSYQLRDCHEDTQYAFLDRDDLINHLNKVYQFNVPINLDGMAFPEYSSIEYIIVRESFNNNLEQQLEIKILGMINQNGQDNNVDVEHNQPNNNYNDEYYDDFDPEDFDPEEYDD